MFNLFIFKKKHLNVVSTENLIKGGFLEDACMSTDHLRGVMSIPIILAILLFARKA